MKAINFIVTAVIVVISGAFTNAQSHDHSQMVSTKTESIKVGGNCDMCKARIEKAAKIEGVSEAGWNKDTKILTLIYYPDITTSNKVQERIAAVGHDTEKFKADNKIYGKLPACCHYERIN